MSADQLWYEATIDDPKFYTAPWTTGWVTPLAPKEWEIMEYACTDNNKDLYDGHLQNGPLDGSLRDGTALAPPNPAAGRGQGPGGGVNAPAPPATPAR